MNKKRRLFLLLCFGFGLIFSLNGWGQDRQKSAHIQAVEKPPKIDGLLHDDCWQNREPLQGFFQYDPVNGTDASEDTLAWLAYDKKNLYLAFYLKDSQPGKIWAELTPRNSYGENDSITVILDTYNDKRTSIEFTINPKGIQKNTVETIWKSAAVMAKDGWTAEIAIPFKSLRFSSKDNQVWGINFRRYIHRLKETDYWTRVSRDIPLLQQMGELVGLQGIKPSYNIELFPYFGYRSSHWDGDVNNKMAVGLDFKYGILPNLILDMTASPDFSEVESDPFIYQLSPYENYFNENRPFFSEGSQYFGETSEEEGMPETQFNLFYSRRISNPRFAAKLTGKQAGYSFGILGAVNKEEGDDSIFSVVRIQKDVFRNSQLGIYYSGINQGDDYNRNLGLDYRFNFKDIYYIRGQSAFSFNSDTGNKNNGMHVIQFTRTPDAGLSYSLYYNRVEKNVKVETGYIAKTDTQFADVDLGYSWRFNKGSIKHLFLNTSANWEYDCGGTNMLRSLSILSEMEFLSKLWLLGWIEFGKSKYQVLNDQNELEWTDRFINTYSGEVSLEWERGGWLKGIGFEGEWERQGIYNRDFTAVEPGLEQAIEFFLTLKPKSCLEFSLGGEWTRQTIDRTGEKVFDGLTYETSLHFQVTRALFLNTQLKGETRDEQYNLDVLVGYYFGAGNIVQLSFKHSSRHEDSLREKGWSVTLKFSYLLRI